jgi:hypothetical protein
MSSEILALVEGKNKKPERERERARQQMHYVFM